MSIALEMVGRPPNGTKQFQVQLAPEQVARVDAMVGTYKRSEFIREAVERELERRERIDTQSDKTP
jgi:Arc/MetJ-type ribon-helix-helix transcriptional regulator